MSIDSNAGIRKQDGSTVISSVARNQIGRDIAWNWLRNEWNRISAHFGARRGKTIGRVVKAISSDFNTPLKLKELKEFYADHELELGSAKRNTLISIQNVKANVKWMKDNYHMISDWLKSKINTD